MTVPAILRKVARASSETIQALEGFGAATIHEAQGRTGLLATYMRPIYCGACIAGPAITVSLPPGDNLTIHVAVEICEPGDILVVTPTSVCTDGYFGELLATSLRVKGVKGLIIEAGCRDVRALTTMKFPVWSRAISCQGTVKATLGFINIPVVCAGAQIKPGDVVIADDDGIVVVPRENAAMVLEASRERVKKEALNRERLASGELGLDVYGWREKVNASGLKEL